jgi:DNA-binding CsgD family transcriptional regulator
MRSAIHQAMSLTERLSAHAALAAVLDDDPDRRAWHRAAASVGPDERIAAELEAAAHRANRRGAQVVALAAFERAAELARDAERRGSRLLDAAVTAMILGRPRDCARLLEAVHDEELRPVDRPLAAWLRELYAEGAWSGASRVASFVEIADRMRAAGDVERGIQALRYVALRCWWSNPDAEARGAFCAVVKRFPELECDARLLYCLAMVDPVEHGAYVIERVSRGWRERPEYLGNDAHNFGIAAQAVGDFLHAERFLEIEIQQRRALGWLGQLGLSLVSQSWTKIQRGDWKQAGSMASEAVRLTEETQQPLWTAAAHLAGATIAAYRGDIPLALKLAAEGERELLPRGAGPMLALVNYPRGAAAMAAGHHDEAYEHLRRIFDPADSAFHTHLRSWVLVDLVEAAVQSGHEDDATRFVRDLEPIAAQSRSPLLLGALSFAHQVLSPDDAGFEASPAAIVDFPFIRARLQLAHGLWLRRQSRPADARTPLRAARDAFDALGALPWGERARQELRASGETSRRRGYDLLDALSPQEFQIAQLAAAGLSNKEIGQQLFLSHRTVSSHLCKVFPKLGITARSHLSAALKARSAPSS